MTDFKNALLHLLPEEVRKSFSTLDAEQTRVTAQQPNDIRIEPSVEEIGVQWSLSQWRNLRTAPAGQNDLDGTDFNEADLPGEIQEVRSVFPSFYASMNN